ncbi:hypothetical protein M0802_008787 [Mischocyttarus mexicanus]|nr:hypothetical protein M0802_008787 [Mischocyttarus mexicanus]
MVSQGCSPKGNQKAAASGINSGRSWRSGRAVSAAIAIATATAIAIANGIRSLSFVGVGRTGSMIQECSQECQRKRDILSLIHERYLEVSLCRGNRNPGNIVVVGGDGGGGNGGGVEGAVAARRREWKEDFTL